MCGIFGYAIRADATLNSRDLGALTDRLFLLSESRGKEAAGMCARRPEGLHVYKRPVAASRMIREPAFERVVSDHVTATSLDGVRSFIGHSRLVTHGDRAVAANNQPVALASLVGVHNGILCNTGDVERRFECDPAVSDLDSEVLFRAIEAELVRTDDIGGSLASVFGAMEGNAAVAFYPAGRNVLVLASNMGALYCAYDATRGVFVFASEVEIVDKIVALKSMKSALSSPELFKIGPLEGAAVDLVDLTCHRLDLKAPSSLNLRDFGCTRATTVVHSGPSDTADRPAVRLARRSSQYLTSKAHRDHFEDWDAEISRLRRCTRCVLPASYPFIEFDDEGVCSFCRTYEPIKMKSMDELYEYCDRHRRTDGQPDCLLALSGGRDSCYAMHYATTQLGMHPVTYTYDWGLVTDLARRNTSRMCGKLGVEHILISADMEKKRRYVRQNVNAWLKRPHLGIIPLFMAGDKEFHACANRLSRQKGISSLIFGMNELENCDFKEGFCGVNRRKHVNQERFYDLSVLQKAQMMFFYGMQYLRNPSYINSSIPDTLKAFANYYIISHDYLVLFSYIDWDEKLIESTLIDEYNWEVAEDTSTTWRIGDGTAAFYNYIYYTVAGFTESDAFRSNQVREGSMTRDEALQACITESRPRYASLLWYCDIIGLDPDHVFSTIDRMPRLFAT